MRRRSDRLGLATALQFTGRPVFEWAGIALLVLLVVKILVLLAEPFLTFMPVAGLAVTPAEAGLPYEDTAVTTPDGVTLHGWFVPGIPDHGNPRPITLLYFHGNAENIAPYVALARLTRTAGYHLLLIDYRGYGRSTGRPTETGIYADGEAALGYLRARSDVDPERIVLWGRSIGAAVAVHLAAGDANVAGVILESSFTSARDLLREGGAFVLYPLSFFASYRFDQAGKIPRVTAPLLVLHGTDDTIAPFVLGRRLHDLAPGRKRFVAIEAGGHNDLLARHGSELWAGVREFLESLR